MTKLLKDYQIWLLHILSSCFLDIIKQKSVWSIPGYFILWFEWKSSDGPVDVELTWLQQCLRICWAMEFSSTIFLHFLFSFSTFFSKIREVVRILPSTITHFSLPRSLCCLSLLSRAAPEAKNLLSRPTEKRLHSEKKTQISKIIFFQKVHEISTPQMKISLSEF